MDIERKTVHHDPMTDESEVVHTREHIPSDDVVSERQANKADAIIWYIVSLIDILLLARLSFLILGARNTGFASFLYQITSPFVAPFRGIFASPSSETGYFDSAAMLAMVVYALIGWAITSLVDISKRNAPA